MGTFILMTVVTAFRILGRNRLRTGLTMLGVIIGVGAVIAMVSIGEGAKAAVRAQIASMGTNMLSIKPGTSSASGVRGGQGGAVTLTVADALDLKKKVPLLKEIAWVKKDVLQIVNGNRNWNGEVNGISPGYLTVRNWDLVSGGPITDADLDAEGRGAGVGQTGGEDPYDRGGEALGATIRLRNVGVTVIGVLAPQGHSAGGAGPGDIVFMPLTTAARQVPGTPFLRSVSGRY